MVTLNSSANNSVHRPYSFYNMANLGPACNTISECNLVTCTSSLSRVNPVTGGTLSTTTVFSIVDNESRGSNASYGPGPFALSSVGGTGSLGNGGVNVPSSCFNRNVSLSITTGIGRTTRIVGSLNTRIRRFSVPVIGCTVPACCVVTYTRTYSGLSEFSNVGCNCGSPSTRGLHSICFGSHSRNFNVRIGGHVVLNGFILSDKCFSTCCGGTLGTGKLVIGTFGRTFRGCSFLLNPITPAATLRVNGNLDGPLTVCLNSVCAIVVGVTNLPSLTLPYKFSNSGVPIKVRLVNEPFSRGAVLTTNGTCRNRATFRLRGPRLSWKKGFVRCSAIYKLRIRARLTAGAGVFYSYSARFNNRPGARIYRVYSNVPNALPILGGGILRFTMEANLTAGYRVAVCGGFSEGGCFCPSLPGTCRVDRLCLPVYEGN